MCVLNLAHWEDHPEVGEIMRLQQHGLVRVVSQKLSTFMSSSDEEEEEEEEEEEVGVPLQQNKFAMLLEASDEETD